MQTLRKKTSPLKYKNETTRFLGDGVSFKAKLIGILEVSEARGDRMCQEALSDLKMAIRAAGEHKQRITINIAIDGLRLRDEKTGDSLYHHPVHKISFIAQDMTDSRAFGYIFGSPDTGHRFFGIKTDKAASQVVIAMRDLFQVVFALKKKEIELAKQFLDKNRGYNGSPLYSDSSVSSTKSIKEEILKSTTTSETKPGTSSTDTKAGGTAVADLVDLELELNSLQQGLNQMERITPSDPFGSKDDPFGDSFISYQPKPILPPPPSSGRERSSRTSEASSIFSPKTPHTSSVDSSLETSLLSAKSTKKDFSFSHEFSASSHEEPTSADWFTPPTSNTMFEEPALVPEPSKDEKHEMAKKEILSQFDVFTELDPLGTGRSKPYIDKKHFFQELKNPPKKVLNDLVPKTQAQEQPKMFNTNFNQTIPVQPLSVTTSSNTANVFSADPFGEDPFVKEDPFAGEDFSNKDPFETEFGDFKLYGRSPGANLADSLKLDQKKSDNIQPFYQSNLSRSPKSSMLEKQMSMISTSPKTVQFSKQNTFDSFEKFGEKSFNKISQLHENPSLDMSSESECAPEPPPRPAATLMQIKPPPLPPKKQPNDLSYKPPPRPPHTEDPHYDFIDNYETAPSSLDYFKASDKSPPLPVPIRKSKFESDFTSVPERPKKQFNLQSSEEDYLTPISFPEPAPDLKVTGPVLLPPPQRSARKQAQSAAAAVTVPPLLESVPSSKTSTASVSNDLNAPLENLDINLSQLTQLTLTGLNELAAKLNIPASQLSNMTLVQLTNYICNVIQSKGSSVSPNTTSEANPEFPAFKADFAANFNDFNTASSESYDRYAVFRELMQEEIKQTKIDTEPEEIREEKEEMANSVDNVNNLDDKPVSNEINNYNADKYAALREIVETELRQSEVEGEDANKNETETANEFPAENNDETNKNIESVENDINLSNKFNADESEKQTITKDNIIEYNTQLDNKIELQITTPNKPPKSPSNNKVTPVKSPVPVAITEIMQSNTRMTSGSLSDVVSGSSPEVDNTGSNSEVGKKAEDAAGESWAIFDQPNVPDESFKEKQPVQSEEGISPWSSDSKEFGNGSPPEWRQRVDSESGGEKWVKSNRRRDQEGWWDTSAEPEAQYYPPNRRSTDSYDEEYYECYDRPRRRRQTNWSGQTAGGHSSSSRDVSPWEEEPRRREPGRESRSAGWSRHPRQHSFERRRERRPTDSWDEEDDYEYEDEQIGRYHWSERHSSRDSDRDRHSAGSRDHDSDRWADEWGDDRRHRRRREVDRDRWCCPDWEETEHDQMPGRYGSRERWPGQDGPPGKWRDRKHDDRNYNRDSQDSPWEDDYSNDPEESQSPHYLSAKRNWKRPSSASEMDRKTGEIKSRHYLGGSDGERDRRYKGARRSRSRDSQYSDPSHRHRPDVGAAAMRSAHRGKQHPHQKSQFDQHPKLQFDAEFMDSPPKKQVDSSKFDSNKKTATLATRKKPKDSPKTEENIHATFPRKSSSRAKSLFENDFVSSEEPVATSHAAKFSFENDFETSEAESPVVNKPHKTVRHSGIEMRHLPLELRQRGSFKENKISPRFPVKSKSLFEDDFSPSDKAEHLPEDNGISCIKEENDQNEEDDSFSANRAESATNSRKKILNKNRLSSGLRTDMNLKKSESINIFARESDPFDDDFFCGEATSEAQVDSVIKKVSPRNVELKWTEDFEDFDIENRK